MEEVLLKVTKDYNFPNEYVLILSVAHISIPKKVN